MEKYRYFLECGTKNGDKGTAKGKGMSQDTRVK